MQLIAETEAVLDVERNMSTVENIQNNKVDKLDIEDLNKPKCNGIKEVIELNTSSEDEGSKEVTNEIEEALANIPMSIENNEAELNNVDLSEIISEQNSLETKNAQTDESQNLCSEKELNGSDNPEKVIITHNELKDIPEEDDYLEDDIISIHEEPFQLISDPIKENENIVNNDTSVLEKLQEIIKREKTEEIKEPVSPVQIENCQLVEDDVIELLEEPDDLPVQSEKESLICKDKNKESDSSTLREGNETELLIQVEEDKIKTLKELNKDSEQVEDIEIIIKQTDPAVQSKEETVLCEQEVKDNMDVVEIKLIESPGPCVTKIEEEKHIMDVTEETESHVLGEIETNVSIEKPKQDEINLIEEDKVVEQHDVSKIIEEVKETTAPCEKGTDLNIVKSGKIESKVTEKAPSENKLDSTIEDKDEIQIIEDTEVVSIECDNNTKLPTEVTPDIIVSTEDTKSEVNTTNPIEASKCDSDEASKIGAVDAPIVLKDDAMDLDATVEEPVINTEQVDAPIVLKDDMDVEEVIEKTTTPEVISEEKETVETPAKNVTVSNVIDQPIICKLSNTLDILSDDDEEEPPKTESLKVDTPKVEAPKVVDTKEKQCIDIEDDDDIMVIDEETTNKTETSAPTNTNNKEEVPKVQPETNAVTVTGEQTVEESKDLLDTNIQKETTSQPTEVKDSTVDININDKTPETPIEQSEPAAQLVTDNFVNTAKKKLADMTREELEEFCILKIVESIVDRSSLSEINSKIKCMTQGLDEYRRKVMMLTKQNRDLQVVLKSIQEEQKKVTIDTPITPLKITRSVGMQVFMEKTAPKKKGAQQNMPNRNMNNPQPRNVIPQGPRPQKINQNIPVPRLVPANSPALKTPNTVPQINQINVKNVPPNGIVKTPSPNTKAEKRPFNKVGASNVTVDLTDDEPPAKLPGSPRTSPAPPIRLVTQQNLIAAQRQSFGPGVNRKVYIPISGQQNQTLRPGQTIMLKTVSTAGLKPRCPPMTMKIEPGVKMSRGTARHPAPLPAATKQYQPPNWKPLPPAPDIKLTKVENGIVISWKIEDVPEDSYEEIASFQLYAYQETVSPPNTSLWKKIGDVKALPLPMACTLTQFMAGFKYYFAVRAIDIKSRIGPFSLPGSILLLSKNM